MLNYVDKYNKYKYKYKNLKNNISGGADEVEEVGAPYIFYQDIQWANEYHNFNTTIQSVIVSRLIEDYLKRYNNATPPDEVIIKEASMTNYTNAIEQIYNDNNIEIPIKNIIIENIIIKNTEIEKHKISIGDIYSFIHIMPSFMQNIKDLYSDENMIRLRELHFVSSPYLLCKKEYKKPEQPYKEECKAVETNILKLFDKYIDKCMEASKRYITSYIDWDLREFESKAEIEYNDFKKSFNNIKESIKNGNDFMDILEMREHVKKILLYDFMSKEYNINDRYDYCNTCGLMDKNHFGLKGFEVWSKNFIKEMVIKSNITEPYNFYIMGDSTIDYYLQSNNLLEQLDHCNRQAIFENILKTEINKNRRKEIDGKVFMDARGGSAFLIEHTDEYHVKCFNLDNYKKFVDIYLKKNPEGLNTIDKMELSNFIILLNDLCWEVIDLTKENEYSIYLVRLIREFFKNTNNEDNKYTHFSFIGFGNDIPLYVDRRYPPVNRELSDIRYLTLMIGIVKKLVYFIVKDYKNINNYIINNQGKLIEKNN